MDVQVLLGPGEAERLKTAAFRFAELKARSPEAAPPVALSGDSGGPTGRVALWSAEAAAEFRSYWSAFRSEQPRQDGWRDF